MFCICQMGERKFHGHGQSDSWEREQLFGPLSTPAQISGQMSVMTRTYGTPYLAIMSIAYIGVSIHKYYHDGICENIVVACSSGGIASACVRHTPCRKVRCIPTYLRTYLAIDTLLSDSTKIHILGKHQVMHFVRPVDCLIRPATCLRTYMIHKSSVTHSSGLARYS